MPAITDNFIFAAKGDTVFHDEVVVILHAAGTTHISTSIEPSSVFTVTVIRCHRGSADGTCLSESDVDLRLPIRRGSAYQHAEGHSIDNTFFLCEPPWLEPRAQL